MRQGFYFNQDVCIGCKTCQVACKDKNDLEVGVLFRSVGDYETGSYPKPGFYSLSTSCNHCENPACVAVCPQEAMYVNEEDGTIQHDDEKCIGCEMCAKACPYDQPKLIESLGVVHKCDACIGLRAAGEMPACVSSCIMRALEFGPIDELRSAHPDSVSEIACMPLASETNPSLAIEVKQAALDPAYRGVML